MNRDLPCPLCSAPLDVRKSIKGKPYTVCDRCGMQMFIRKEAGISALKAILADGKLDLKPDRDKLREKVDSLEQELVQKGLDLESARQAEEELSQIAQKLQEKHGDLLKSRRRQEELEEKLTEYEKELFRTCPECGEKFRIRDDLIKTSWFDGEFEGYRCPSADCEGVIAPLKEN